jgi:hypothetical protein
MRRGKKLRLQHVALILLVFGIVLTMLSYLNYMSWTVQFNAGTVIIAPNSSNESSFFASIRPDLKKVEFIVANGPWGMRSMWGDCVWIKHPFQITLIGGQGAYVEITTDTPPRVDYTFDVPIGWNTLDRVRISNPENQPVAVIVEVMLHRQTLNPFWETAMIIGLIVAVIGIILLAMSIRKGRTSVPPSNTLGLLARTEGLWNTLKRVQKLFRKGLTQPENHIFLD